ncbi:MULTISPECIES: hypothetical protein [Furfurilactobacillus]|uniref:Uncharacterized protein n=1 Tax=Furfurilactobacillus rossiae TaxID=231049 RepID=A0A7C9MRN0_9LACO|nr:hypothetical protein [Furfurilactobacillus milii]MYV05923.1 hypothetical protein [Furfurilactobacillus milii]
MNELPKPSSSYFIVTNEASIDFKVMLEDYDHVFAGHRVRIETNYNLLSEFDIVFTERDFPYLMGWEKLTSKNVNASQLIRQVKAGTLAKTVAKTSSLWGKQIKKGCCITTFCNGFFRSRHTRLCSNKQHEA